MKVDPPVITLRRTTAQDTEVLITLLRDADEDENRIRRVVIGGAHICYLALFDGEIVGAAVVDWKGSLSEIEYLAISSEKRGLGLGRALMTALEAEALLGGASCLLVGTDNTSMDAIFFYQKCGFRLHSVRRDHFAYIQPSVVLGGIVMRDMLVLSKDFNIESSASKKKHAKITQTMANEVPRLFEIWETSTRASHAFLTEVDLQKLIPLVKKELKEFNPIYCLRNDLGIPYAILGVQNCEIEMLFVHADYRGQGAGRMLVEFAIEVLSAKTVTVNEQNDQAIGFYQHMGFKTLTRSETDGYGHPFPILHMGYFNGK